MSVNVIKLGKMRARTCFGSGHATSSHVFSTLYPSRETGISSLWQSLIFTIDNIDASHFHLTLENTPVKWVHTFCWARGHGRLLSSQSRCSVRTYLATAWRRTVILWSFCTGATVHCHRTHSCGLSLSSPISRTNQVQPTWSNHLVFVAVLWAW